MVALLLPSLDRLPAYMNALAQGWSPNTTRDVTGEQLAAIESDPAAFVADLLRHEGGGPVVAADGSVHERLPFRIFWIHDGAGTFCGAINLRFQHGTLALPPHVSGHVGYAVVPWMRCRGIATAALRLILPVAHGLGLPRVLLTCDVDNEPSARVIAANGGVPAGIEPTGPHGAAKRLFWVETAE